MKLDMKVNHLPVLTWNKLKLNDADVKAEFSGELPVYTFYASGLSEGVEIKTDVTADEVKKMSEGLKIENKREAYVAGKYPIYAKQQFATGMGVEIDELFESNNVLTDVITVADNVSAKEPLLLHFSSTAAEKDELLAGWKTEIDENDEDADPDSVKSFAGKKMEALKKSEKPLFAQLIVVGENSEVTIALDFTSDDESTELIGISTRLYLKKGAKVKFVKIQRAGNKTLVLNDTGAIEEEYAQLDYAKLELGGEKTYTGVYSALNGKKSIFYFDCGFFVNEKRILDGNFVATQRGRETDAKMFFKGVLADEAQKVFRETIDMRLGSEGSLGDEQEDSLLLGDNVINKAMPIILCEEEKVEARHGATIGKISDEMLFYMQTRGIEKVEAEKMIVRGKLNDVSRKIPDEGLSALVRSKIEEGFKNL